MSVGALSPADIQQIVSAIESLDWVQGVKAMLAEQAGTNATIPPAEGPAEEAGEGEAPEAPPAEEPADEPPIGGEATPPPIPPNNAEPPAPPAAPPAPPAEPPAAPPAAPAKKEPEKMAAAAPTQPRRNYAADLDAMPDVDFHKYCAERMAKYAAGCAETKPYSAEGSIEQDSTVVTKSASVMPSEPTKEGSVEEPEHKDGDGVTERFAKIESELRVERGKRIDAERYNRLSDLRQRFAFDLDSEMQRCCYAKMNDEQFTAHAGDGGAIETNYREMPLNAPFAPQERDEPPATRKTEKYTKAHRDRAVSICTRLVEQGEPFNYDEIIAQVASGQIK